jgi:hypothetical protein
MAKTRREAFSIGEILDYMRKTGSPYPDSTIRTHIVSVMCANAPHHHGVKDRDLERIDRGIYRLVRPGTIHHSVEPVLATATPRALRKVERVQRRIGDLVSTFDDCLARFESDAIFAGPTLYFHLRTLETLRAHVSPAQALDDQRWFDYLYATLASWGMHRMGPRGAKLRPMDDLRDSFQGQRPAIAEIQRLRLHELSSDEVKDVAHRLWSILSGLKVGIGQTILIANSKALHHLLPELMPPVDRQYTLMFFFNSTMLPPDTQERTFKTMYPYFHEIALACRDRIFAALDAGRSPWNTSTTKVIDNAVIGYMAKTSSSSASEIVAAAEGASD